MRGVVTRPARPLRDWFFEEGDAAGAAALRIAYGLTGLFMLWDLHPVLDDLLGHAGYFGTLDPRYVDASGFRGLLFRFDSPLALRIWFWGYVLITACLTLGLFARLASVLALGCLVLLQARNPYMLFGADVLFFQIGLWLPFVRLDGAWSLGRRLGRFAAADAPSVIPLWPLKTIQIQVALVYFVTAVTKLGTDPWRDGSAVYYALNTLGSDVAPGLLEQKLLLTLMTYGTLWIELSFAFLVFWRPTRWLALAQAAALHLAIDVLMIIRFFGPVMYMGLLAFVRPSEWRAIHAAVAARLPRWGDSTSTAIGPDVVTAARSAEEAPR
jgi:hypothetical protein